MMWYRWAVLLYCLYRAISYESAENLQRLKRAALASGVIGIKMMQFIVMHDGVLSKFSKSILADVLERCDQHDWQYTVATYRIMFGHEITDDFDVPFTAEPRPIGSGSIGQVYKLYHRRLHQYVAVKVRHPNVATEVRRFVSWVSWFARSVRIPYHIIITEFLANIEAQLDYIQEATNMNALRANHASEPHIVIPEVLAATPEIIIMTYHEGVPFTNICEKTARLRVANNVFLFMSSSLVCHRFVHCDMHYGNWKIDPTDEKIIIYDCGVIGTVPHLSAHAIRDLFLASLDGDLNKIGSSICPDGARLPVVRSYIEELMNKEYSDPVDRFADFLKRVFAINVDVDRAVLRCLQGLMICMSTISESTADTMTRLGIKGTKYTMPVFIVINYEQLRRDPSERYAQLAEHFGAWIAEDPSIERDYSEWEKMNISECE